MTQSPATPVAPPALATLAIFAHKGSATALAGSLANNGKVAYVTVRPPRLPGGLPRYAVETTPDNPNS